MCVLHISKTVASSVATIEHQIPEIIHKVPMNGLMEVIINREKLVFMVMNQFCRRHSSGTASHQAMPKNCHLLQFFPCVLANES